MDPHQIIVIATAFGAVTCLILALAVYLHGRQSAQELMNRRIGGDEPVGPLEVPPDILARDATGWLDRKFYSLLAESGSDMSPVSAMLLVLGVGLIAGAAVFVAFEIVPAALAAALVGFTLPILWWMWQRGRRISAMRRTLPAALDQLADSLRAGQTLEQAAELTAVQAPSPLKEEFASTVALLRMGQSPVAVMDRMARRIPLPEFRLFATAVLVHRQTGGNLANLTSRLAASARERQESRRHVAAQTVAGRYSAIGLILCGVIGFTVLSFRSPQYMSFFWDHPEGLRYLAIAAGLLIVGVIWIQRIVRVSY